MQLMTLAAALLLSPGNKAYQQMEDGTFLIVEQLKTLNDFVMRASQKYIIEDHYQIKDGVPSVYTGRISREALAWLPLEVMYRQCSKCGGEL